MRSRPPPDVDDEAFWRDFLTEGPPTERHGRRVLRRIPHGPRCRMCAAPFSGIGATVMRVIGRSQSSQNPNVCGHCFAFLAQHHGGAEIECTLLFADVRGSTTLAEGVSASDFKAILGRFYDIGAEAVIAHDGFVVKFVGDEIVAIFFPLLAGDDHAAKAISAARSLLVATGHTDPAGPWLPIGAGVHTGQTWVGAVGEGTYADITPLGDSVNTTARLASSAAAGEILVTSAAASAAGIGGEHEMRPLELKGKSTDTDVISLRVDGQG